MPTQKKTLTVLMSLSLATATFACDKPSDEYREALPDRSVLTVDFPENGTTQQGLTADGSQTSAIVGGPAHYYTATYYQAREINGFGKFVLKVLEEITSHEPTEMTDDTAVWGPFSDDGEPNEFRLIVERVELAVLHYRWALQGKHKSTGDDGYINLAGGALEPEPNNKGKGWFAVDFENIRTLNPAENGRGKIAYAFLVNDQGVHVRALFEGPNNLKAAYAYGKSAAGAGFILFALPENVDENPAKEALLIRTIWNDTYAGRADAVASLGDLGTNVVHATQCWDETFASTYESLRVNGAVSAEDGDAATCGLQGEVPEDETLPEGGDLENPYELE